MLYLAEKIWFLDLLFILLLILNLLIFAFIFITFYPLGF